MYCLNFVTETTCVAEEPYCTWEDNLCKSEKFSTVDELPGSNNTVCNSPKTIVTIKLNTSEDVLDSMFTEIKIHDLLS